MFTLRLIFYGLIALVPDPDGKGVTALMVEAPGHKARIAMLKGICDINTDCELPSGQGKFALDWQLTTSGLIKAKLSFNGQLSSSNVNLDFRVDGAPPVGFPTTPPLGKLQPINPWLPRMSRIHNGKQKIENTCVNGLATCEIVGRWIVTKAKEIGVCHFAHTVRKIGNQKFNYVTTFAFSDDEFNVYGPARSIADAISVEISLEGKAFELVLTKPLGESRAKLEPVADANGRKLVTLVISNNDFSRSSRSPRHLHFKNFYNVAGTSTSSDERRVPLLFSKKRASPGPCETELEDFEKPILMTNGSHSQQECDLVAFTER